MDNGGCSAGKVQIQINMQYANWSIPMQMVVREIHLYRTSLIDSNISYEPLYLVQD